MLSEEYRRYARRRGVEKLSLRASSGIVNDLEFCGLVPRIF